MPVSRIKSTKPTNVIPLFGKNPPRNSQLFNLLPNIVTTKESFAKPKDITKACTSISETSGNIKSEVLKLAEFAKSTATQLQIKGGALYTTLAEGKKVSDFHYNLRLNSISNSEEYYWLDDLNRVKEIHIGEEPKFSFYFEPLGPQNSYLKSCGLRLSPNHECFFSFDDKGEVLSIRGYNPKTPLKLLSSYSKTLYSKSGIYID